MSIFESIRMALTSIKANKMRSFLTMLGIIIGISSVIMVVSLGQGGQKSITGQFEKVGTSNVNINIDEKKAQTTDYFTLKDIEQIKLVGENIKYVTPSNSARGDIFTDIDTKTAVVSGGSPDSAYINNVEIVYGRYYNEREYEGATNVALIDENTAMTLFGFKDATGQSATLDIGGVKTKITMIGIVKSSGFGGGRNGAPAFVNLPATFLKNVMGDKGKINALTIMATSQNELESAGNRALRILELRHGNTGEGKYILESATMIIDQINNVLGILTSFIGAIAAISLVVGGIGIMNIMLVSVTERTREIGIRKSIGATTGNIMVQFLMEAVIISLIGGFVGLSLGIIGAYVIGSFAGFEPSISAFLVFGTLIFSSVVGIFFGIYPAKKAATLNPIDALRYE